MGPVQSDCTGARATPTAAQMAIVLIGRRRRRCRSLKYAEAGKLDSGLREEAPCLTLMQHWPEKTRRFPTEQKRLLEQIAKMKMTSTRICLNRRRRRLMKRHRQGHTRVE